MFACYRWKFDVMDLTIKAILALFWLCRVNVLSAPRQPRLSLAETMPSYFYRNIGGNPNTYSFSYDVSDPATGNTQFRTEERYPNGTVAGAYGFVDAFAIPQRYKYIADKEGYRVYQDIPHKPIGYGMQTVHATNNPLTEPTEPSVTWTRPKRPNKNKVKTDFAINLETQRKKKRQSKK